MGKVAVCFTFIEAPVVTPADILKKLELIAVLENLDADPNLLWTRTIKTLIRDLGVVARATETSRRRDV